MAGDRKARREQLLKEMREYVEEHLDELLQQAVEKGDFEIHIPGTPKGPK